MSIRFRLAATCIVVALLPAIPLSILVSSLLEKSFKLGLSETIEGAMDSGIAVSRMHLEGIRGAFESEVERAVAAQTSSRTLPAEGLDSARVARVLAEVLVSREIDGFILGRTIQRGEEVRAGVAPHASARDTVAPAAASAHRSSALPPELGPYSAIPAFAAITGGAAVVERPASPAGAGRTADTERTAPQADAGRATPSTGAARAVRIPDVTFYETENRTVELALWSPPGSATSLLLYKRIDPEFVAHADRLLSGRQLFAQLRLAQGKLNRSFFYPFIFIYAVILLLSLGFAFLMSERLIAPIRRLVAATSAVAAGDWRVQLKEGGGGEIGRLVESFNRMVSRLDAQRRRLIDLEKMASWREMARHLAHEIKNPLLPIRLTVQEMKDQYTGGDERYGALLSESVRVVENELNHLQRLVKEFSSFARMPGLSLASGSIEQLVRDVARLYTQVEVSVEAGQGVPESRFDPDQMRRVFVNLFDNSLSMFPEVHKGRIQIRIRSDGDSVAIDFADNGPGIPAENMAKVFEPYFSTRKGGGGLGLAIVKNIILLHEGTIEACTHETGGALFTITLPIAGPSVVAHGVENAGCDARHEAGGASPAARPPAPDRPRESRDERC
ncbi:MAG: ATP-binding protein, partial [Candidatus Eisenbacteria bacterium]